MGQIVQRKQLIISFLAGNLKSKTYKADMILSKTIDRFIHDSVMYPNV